MIPPTTHELKNHTVELARFGQGLPRSIGGSNNTRTGVVVIVAMALIALIIVVPAMYPQIGT